MLTGLARALVWYQSCEHVDRSSTGKVNPNEDLQ